MIYNWQQKDWTKFRFKQENLEDLLLTFTEKTGLAKGLLKTLSEQNHKETLIDMLVSEAIKTSEIEGEFLSRKDVMSSIKNNLGINTNPEPVKDIQAQGMAALVTEIHTNYTLPLTETMLFDWHKMIFPRNTRISVGTWRSHSEPMQVISGSYGREKIHFEAPPSKDVPNKMAAFIKWFNDSAPNGPHKIKHAPIRSAIAHLYFESIHPFEDGNGRIGRALAEKALLQTLNFPLLISLSIVIEADRNAYYQALKLAQKSNEITAWLFYFCISVIIHSPVILAITSLSKIRSPKYLRLSL
jgi:Fic family protein